MNSRALTAVFIALATTMIATGCTPKSVEPLPPAPKQRGATTSTTEVPDFSAMELGPPAPGRTTTTVNIGPGRATVKGTVAGPDGPVAGAVVRAERLVGDARATMDIVTGEDGSFTVPKVLGGRYRVRTWKANPDNLALVEPLVFFLEGSETKTVELAVSRFQGVAASAAIAPDPPVIDSAANLVVQVVDQAVDGEGIVRSNPLPGVRVELFGSGDWRIASSAVTTTDSAGRARWLLECRRAGDQPLSVVVGEGSTFNLNLPGCVVPPPTEDDEDPDATTTTSRAGTTTTSRASTTTTARPSTTTSRPATTTTRPATTTTSSTVPRP